MNGILKRTAPVAFLVLRAGLAAAGAAAPWPGLTEVGSAPAWLAPGVLTTEVTTRDLALTPTMDEAYFSMAGAGYGHAIICVARREDGAWTAPETASFSGDPRWIDLEPFVAPDGARLYFMSTRNAAGDGAGGADLWFVERREGGWGAPQPIGPPVNTPADEFFPAVTAGGTLYFTRAEAEGGTHSIWRSRPADGGGFTEPQRLPDAVNAGSNRFNAWVEPDESRIILSVVGMPGNHGLADYWQVRRRDDDTWEPPENLGPRINRGLGRGWSPCVTPDGRTFAYMAAPVGDSPWPRTWGQLQGRHRTPGAAGGIAVVDLAGIAAAGAGTAELAGTAAPVAFPAVSGPWLGRTPPGAEPEIFAPGLLSTGLDERDVLVLPGGGEIWYGVMGGGLTTILATRLVDGRWTEPTPVPFHTDPAFACFEPTLAADGSRVLFLTNRAAPGQEQGRGWSNQNIFTSRRTSRGWSEPEALPFPVTTAAAEYFPSLAADGTLFFTREDTAGAAIWAAEPDGDAFAPPVRLPAAVNLTAQVYNATVAPDETWLIACVAGHPDNLGPADYWISFRGPGGEWQRAVNMGPRFNGPGERAASVSVSPDGTILFYSSRRRLAADQDPQRVTPALMRQWHREYGSGSSDLWWVAASVLSEYR